ncbi:hypothetical protein [Devosia sp.]|uniref:hypothetical protein n=1 Tax=Devosia sp. TaxID=1871048 RepID=UPI002EE10EF4
MGRINAAWHEAHKMPTNPTEQQRAEWHYDHALNCGCRAVTPSIAALLETHGYRLPPGAPGLAGRKPEK